jgi:WD40 repeat protein
MYEVLLHPDAQAIYLNADKALAKKIARCLQQLEQTPLFQPNIKVTLLCRDRSNTFMQCLHTIQFEFYDSYKSYLGSFEYLKIIEHSEYLLAHCWNDTGCFANTDIANIWNLRTGKLIYNFNLSGDSANNCIAIAGNNGKVIIDNHQETLYFYSIETGDCIYLSYLDLYPHHYALTSDDQTLFVASDYLSEKAVSIGVYDIYNIKNSYPLEMRKNYPLEQIYSFEGHRHEIRSLLISPDDQFLLSQCKKAVMVDRCIDPHRLWNLKTWELSHIFEKTDLWIAEALAISTSNNLIACGIRDNLIAIWDLHSNEILMSFSGCAPSVMTPDGKIIVYCTDANEIVVWDVESNRQIAILSSGHVHKIERLVISMSKKWIVSSEKYMAKIWCLDII